MLLWDHDATQNNLQSSIALYGQLYKTTNCTKKKKQLSKPDQICCNSCSQLYVNRVLLHYDIVVVVSSAHVPVMHAQHATVWHTTVNNKHNKK